MPASMTAEQANRQPVVPEAVYKLTPRDEPYVAPLGKPKRLHISQAPKTLEPHPFLDATNHYVEHPKDDEPHRENRARRPSIRNAPRPKRA